MDRFEKRTAIDQPTYSQLRSVCSPSRCRDVIVHFPPNCDIHGATSNERLTSTQALR
jgi:hypothetical protein